MKNILKFLFTIYALLCFVILMIPVFLWSLAMLPFGKIKSGNLIYKACIAWADVWFILVFIRHKNIYIEPLQKHQSYIFVSNHISYMDAATIPKTFRKPVRPLGKVEMAKIPIFGTIYKNAIVTVDRSSAANRARSVAILKSILEKEISVLVFPEGTFNHTYKALKDFYDGAFRIAIETGTPIKPVLFLDNYSRLPYDQSLFSLTPGKTRSIFLPQINVEGLTLEDIPKLKQQTFQLMEAHLVRYKASWIKSQNNTEVYAQKNL